MPTDSRFENSIGIVETQYYHHKQPIVLENGGSLPEITIAYETYGHLNSDCDNVILILQGFTADAHAAGYHSESDVNPGWWDNMIGPDKAYDTNKYCVISTNVIGGCKGTTGPSSINPATGCPYATSFPFITIRDMVDVQHLLLEHLGVRSIKTVTGASMGGMQALQWVVSYPEMVRSSIPIACSARLSAQSLAMCDIARTAIMSDPDWCGGEYYGKTKPSAGLKIARMVAHMTFVSAEYLEADFSHTPVSNHKGPYQLTPEYTVQEYLHDEGDSFIKRFDANSYLFLSKAIENFNLYGPDDNLSEAFRNQKAKWLLLSFTSDWLFPTEQLEDIERGLIEVSADVRHEIINTPYGHDSFLTDWTKLVDPIKKFLDSVK